MISTDDADEKKVETKKFHLHYRYNKRKEQNEIILKSKANGKYRAIHTMFNLLNNKGEIIEQRKITTDVADFIFKHFEGRGDTESFNIYLEDLTTGKLHNRDEHKVNLDSIVHNLGNAEHTFTSTGSKLDSHWPIFKKFRDTGYGSIIRATMTNHQLCSSHCHYCSTIARNKRDSISLQEAKDFVSRLYYDQQEYNQKYFPKYNDLYKNITGTDIRLKGLILSGGGQPDLWPFFEEFVDWLAELDIDIGLITNGFPKNVDENVYKHFKWIRISITPEDASPHYIDGEFNKQYIPKTIINNPDITVGYSYVYGSWTNIDIIKRIQSSIENNGFDYCRTLTDCNLTREAQLLAHKDLSEKLLDLGVIDKQGKQLQKIFHQLKYHGTRDEAKELWHDGQCFLQIYNVFWDTTGHEKNGYSYCYACDSITVLAEDGKDKDKDIESSERKFNSDKWGTVKNTDISKLFEQPVKPYFSPSKVCTSCLFMNNNRKVRSLVETNDYSTVKAKKTDHVNFP